MDGQKQKLELLELFQGNHNEAYKNMYQFLNPMIHTFADEKRSHDFLRNVSFMDMDKKELYVVPKERMREFMNLVDVARRENVILHFMEMQKESSGINFGFTLIQRKEERQIKDNLYEKIVDKLVKFIADVCDLGRYFEFKMNEQQLLGRNGGNGAKIEFRFPAYVMIKAKPDIDKIGDNWVYKDRFRVVIPKLDCSARIRKLLLDKIKDKVADYTFGIDSLINENIVDSDSWLSPAPLLGGAYHGESGFTTLKIYDCIIDQRYKIYTKELSGPEMEAVTTHKNLTWLCCSQNYSEEAEGSYTVITKAKYAEQLPVIEYNLLNVIEQDDNIENRISIDAINDIEYGYAAKIISILPENYAFDLVSAKELCRALKSTGETSRGGVENYKRLGEWYFLKNKRTSMEFEEVYNLMLENSRTDSIPVTINTVKHWALRADAGRFREVVEEFIVHEIKKEAMRFKGVLGHYNFARFLYVCFKDEFIFGHDNDGKCEKWYEFINEHKKRVGGELYKWRTDNNPADLHHYITGPLLCLLERAINSIEQDMPIDNQDGTSKLLKGIKKNMERAKSSLTNDSFQTGIIKQARHFFEEKGILDNMDQNHDLFGVHNGIIKVGPQIQLIDGYHEYKISMYSKNRYVEMNINDWRVQYLLRVYADIFIEPDAFEFAMIFACTGLDHRETSGILFILHGGGANGKTCYFKITNNTLGQQYCQMLKTQLITGDDEKANEANAAYMQLKSKSWGYMDESKRGVVINGSRFKQIFSPGMQNARALYGNQENFKNTANIAFGTNFEPIFNTSDHGTWRRILKYNCKSKFTDAPNAENQNEKKKDKRIELEVPVSEQFMEANLGIFGYFYKIYATKYEYDLEKIPIPTIRRETEEYRNKNDKLNKFIVEMFVRSPNAEHIPLDNVAARYEDHAKRYRYDCGAIDDIVEELRNSRVAKNIIKRNNRSYLEGFRIKARVEDPLEAGETNFIDDDLVADVAVGDGAVATSHDYVDNMIRSLGGNIIDFAKHPWNTQRNHAYV
ncbi:putative helicase [Faustovirus]|nr:putative helicase [Faustovirus]QJX71899.1 putative helicase [Faustovirus]QJX72387.1 putative helicase [Faustovirus]QJX72897.1 putative helicase [Faustovirus]QJX73402.1 putative helicase [Faustovirus]